MPDIESTTLGAVSGIPSELGSRLRVIGNGQRDERSEFARDVRAGLLSTPKHIPCRHIYDERGSRLFEQICKIPEYYLTRAEREILESRAGAIAANLTETDAFIELGSGSSAKTRTLIAAILEQRGTCHYVPMDISREILVRSALDLLCVFPNLAITAIAAEYLTGLEHVRERIAGTKCIAWLGSSIGNYSRGDALAMTKRLRDVAGNAGKVLVGIDLRKDVPTLERAYDDAAGVTADFNTNILRRINRELDGDFDLDGFEYRARYDEVAGAVIMGQVSKAAQTVHVGGIDLTVPIAKDEFILTERSLKYSPAEIQSLAEGSGLTIENQWTDSQRQFTLNMMTT